MQNTKQKKLIISILLLLALLSCALFFAVQSQSIKADALESNDSLNFTLATDDEGVQHYKVAIKPVYRVSAEFIVIPNTYEGLPVTEIADNGFLSCAKLSKVIVPSSVIRIGNNAFMNCPNLTQIGMPNMILIITYR